MLFVKVMVSKMKNILAALSNGPRVSIEGMLVLIYGINVLLNNDIKQQLTVYDNIC